MTTVEQLVIEIGSGLHDHGLAKIKEALASRSSVLRSSRTLKDYSIGTKVRFNERTGTRYMVGQTGTVSGIKVKKVVVTLDTAIGKYTRHDGSAAKTVCPIEILDIV